MPKNTESRLGRKARKSSFTAKAQDRRETIYEIADLAYHTMALMVEAGISLDDIRRELASRHIIDKKVKQEKMTS